jgi:hypothetical protein
MCIPHRWRGLDNDPSFDGLPGLRGNQLVQQQGWLP